MNLPKALDAKLGAGSFFAFYKPIQEVCVRKFAKIKNHIRTIGTKSLGKYKDH